MTEGTRYEASTAGCPNVATGRRTGTTCCRDRPNEDRQYPHMTPANADRSQPGEAPPAGTDREPGRMPSPHDRLFKLVLANPDRAAAVLKTYLPNEIVDRLSDAPPKLIDGSFVDPRLRASQSDRLFEVTLTTGKPALIYALLEHKSTPDPMTPFQIEEYKLKIWRRYRDEHAESAFPLPPVVALVLYHGTQPWAVPRSIPEMIDDGIGSAWTRSPGYILHHIGPDGVPELADYPEVRGAFQCLYLSRVTDVQDPVRRLADICAALPDHSDLETAILGYIMRVIQPTHAILEEALRIAKPHRVEIIMGSFYEEVLTKGRAEGRAEGISEGMIKGEAEALLKLAHFKYGAVPQEIATTVRQASQDNVDRWLKALAHAKEIDEIFKS